MYNSYFGKYYELADRIIKDSDAYVVEDGDERIIHCTTRDYQRTHFIITFYKDLLVDIRREIYT